MHPTAALRGQGEACARLGSPMYAALAGHEDDPGPSGLALRLLGSLHRLVLQRRAGALATCYPSVGGRWDLEPAWPALRALLADETDLVREWLDRPPQTNEVGRSAALLGGLLHVEGPWRRPVRLHEIGGPRCRGHGLRRGSRAGARHDHGAVALGDVAVPLPC